MKSLTLHCYKNYSDLIKTIDGISSASSILQFGVTHRGQYILICANENLTPFLSQATDHCFIDKPHAQLLQSYFKQKPVRVEKNFVCLESDKLSTLFVATQRILTTTDFQCIEIVRSMSDFGQARALFANGTSTTIFSGLHDTKSTVISEPSETTQFFY